MSVTRRDDDVHTSTMIAALATPKPGAKPSRARLLTAGSVGLGVPSWLDSHRPIAASPAPTSSTRATRQTTARRRELWVVEREPAREVGIMRARAATEVPLGDPIDRCQMRTGPRAP